MDWSLRSSNINSSNSAVLSNVVSFILLYGKLREQDLRDLELPDRDPRDWALWDRYLPDWELRDRVLPDWELRDRDLPDWELRDRVLRDWELRDRNLPDWELRDRVLPDWELRDRNLPDWELRDRVLRDWELRDRDLPDWELRDWSLLRSDLISSNSAVFSHFPSSISSILLSWELWDLDLWDRYLWDLYLRVRIRFGFWTFRWELDCCELKAEAPSSRRLIWISESPNGEGSKSVFDTTGEFAYLQFLICVSL